MIELVCATCSEGMPSAADEGLPEIPEGNGQNDQGAERIDDSQEPEGDGMPFQVDRISCLGAHLARAKTPHDHPREGRGHKKGNTQWPEIDERVGEHAAMVTPM